MMKKVKNIFLNPLLSFLSGEKSTKQPQFATVKKPKKKEKPAGINLSTSRKKKMTKLKELILQRDLMGENGTTGCFKSPEGEILCLTLEEPWKDNKKGVSCIPEGKYKCTRYISPKLVKKGKSDPEVILLHDVPNRSYVQIHVGNNLDDVEGCIMPGEKMLRDFAYKGKKYEFFISSSAKAFKKIKAITKDKFELVIKNPT